MLNLFMVVGLFLMRNCEPFRWSVHIFIYKFLFILVRTPCKNLNSYNKPFLDFNNGGKKTKRKQENFR
jgi:hypothetical protein